MLYISVEDLIKSHMLYIFLNLLTLMLYELFECQELTSIIQHSQMPVNILSFIVLIILQDADVIFGKYCSDNCKFIFSSKIV